LSPYYNVTLTPLGRHSRWPSLHLTALPSGLVSFHGVAFDARGIVQLASLDTVYRAATFPRAALGIPLRRKCRALHFLHATCLSDTSGNQVAKYVVHYADGRKAEAMMLLCHRPVESLGASAGEGVGVNENGLRLVGAEGQRG